MRKMKAYLLAALILFVASFAVAESGVVQKQYFLSYEQYLSLSFSAQSKYILSLQEFVVSLAKVDGFLVDSESNESKLNLILLLSVESAHGEYEGLDRVCRLGSLKGLSLEELASAGTQTGNCTEVSINGSPQYFRPVAAERLKMISEELLSRMKQGKINPNDTWSAHAFGEFSGMLRQFQERPPKDGNYDHAALAAAISINKELDALWEKGTRQQSFKPKTTKSPPPNKNTEAVRHEASVFFRCLNAGFVIPITPAGGCKPYRQLPPSLDLGFDSENFKCLSQAEIICNPVLFGYEASCTDGKTKDCKSPKPLCIRPSQTATKDCSELAKSRGTLEKVKMLLAGSNGKAIYQDYIKSLYSLCNPIQLEKNPSLAKMTESKRQSVKKDVESTCKVSFKAMADLVTKEYLPKDLGVLKSPPAASNPPSTK
jgi:hypothetical protein